MENLKDQDIDKDEQQRIKEEKEKRQQELEAYKEELRVYEKLGALKFQEVVFKVEEIKFKDDCSIVDNRYSYNGYQINKEGKNSSYNINQEDYFSFLKKCFFSINNSI